MAEKVSYLSRFAVKFVEIVAAGAATAVSGYLVAHFGASWSTPAPPPIPAAVQVAPAQVTPSAAETPKAAASSTPRAQPVPQQDATPVAKPTVRATANAAPGRKRPTTDAAATESKAPRDTAEAKPRDTAEAKPREAAEAKPHETVETKPPDWETVEARIRAALAKADASRPGPTEQPAPTATVAAAPPPAVVPAPKPVESMGGAAPLNGTQASASANAPSASVPPAPIPPASTVATAAPAAEVPQQAVQLAPVPSEPPSAVEIKSRPIASIDASPSPETAAPVPEPQQNAQEGAQADPQTQVKSFFAAIKHIPDMLRTAAPAASPPRPPAPVGD